MKHELYQNGELIAVQDKRTVADSVNLALSFVKQNCKEAIEATGIGWMVERELSGGKAVPNEVKQKCAFLRNKSNEIEQLIIGAASRSVVLSVSDVCDEIENYTFRYAVEIESVKL